MAPPPRHPLVVTSTLTIPWAELTERFSRASGPGGQGVNTTDSRVELSWDVGRSAVLAPVQRERIEQRLGARLVGGVLTVVAAEHREQLRNREAAARRLVAIVAGAVAAPPNARRPTRPTRGSTERRLAAKRRRAETKDLRSSRPLRGE